MFFIETVRNWLRERSRTIFRYYDGKSHRRVDPIRIASAIERECPKYAEHLESLRINLKEIPPGPLMQETVAQQKASRDELIRAARVVFGMTELTDGGGATDAEAVVVLGEFLRFMEQLAEDAELFRDSPGPGAASPPASATGPSVASTTAAS